MKFGKALMLSATFVMLALSSSLLADDNEKAEKKQPENTAQSKEISWMKYDVGLAKAKEEGKHVFIDFTAKWCGWCKKMEGSTFVDPRVVQMLNDNFVSVKVDGDSKEELDVEGYKITERDLTRSEYGVTGYPAFWFLKSDGSKVGQLKGYQQTEKFLEALAFVNDKKYEAETKVEDPAPDGNNN